jgi:xylulokinase
MAIVAGIDSSTQSCTAELREADSGALLGRGSAPHPPTTPPVSEQDPDAWWVALASALRSACSTASVVPASIDAIAVDAQCHGMVTLDGWDRVVRPAKLWNDTMSAPQAERLVRDHGADYWVGRTGSVLGPAFIITKLAWLADTEPANFARVSTVLLPHDYLTWRLSGEFVTDRADASGTGYFSPREGRWQPDLLALASPSADWTARLPAVRSPTEPAGRASRDAIEVLGLREDVVVGPGTGDQYASALGLGVREGDVAIGLGTSGVVFAVSSRPVEDLTGWVNGMADATGRFMPIMVSLNATKVTDWAARILGVDLDTLGALALAAPEDGPSPVMAAFLDGERAPNRPYARGILAGLTTATTREQFARAAFEGVLLGLLRGVDAIAAAGTDVGGRLIITGGGARGHAYRQLLADLSGRDVVVLDVPESSARGACVQAAAVLRAANISDVVEAWAPAPESSVAPRGAPPLRQRERYARVADWLGMDDRGSAR